MKIYENRRKSTKIHKNLPKSTKMCSSNFVQTIFGRSCNIKGINDKNFAVRGFAERQSINAPIQGTAADIIKLAMVEIHNKIISKKINAKMLLQVHDELVFEIENKHCLI